MKKITNTLVIIFLSLLCFTVSFVPYRQADASSSAETESEKIDTVIQKNMDRSKIPGVSVVVVKGSEIVYNKAFGYADVQSKKPASPNTLYELGSTSKTYTALGILYLRDQGLIDLDDPVTTYLPWLKLNYKGKEAVITLRNLLHHTSEIPTSILGELPEISGERAIEDTVRILVDRELKYPPGDRFIYSTINYDVLALIIQQVTGQSYEEFMKAKILSPLGLKQTYIGRNEVPPALFSTGYKFWLGSTKSYDAPMFGGNIPAGYIITSSTDMGQWLKVQLGTAQVDSKYMQLTKESQIANRTVAPFVDGTSYAMGWNVVQQGGGELFHDGSNPNYFSSVVIRPGEQYGVAVLANLNSYTPQKISREIMNILMNTEDVIIPYSDNYQRLDRVSTFILSLFVPLVAVLLYLNIALVVQTLRKTRRYAKLSIKNVMGLLLLLPVIAGFYLCIYYVPYIYIFGYNWQAVKVYGPDTIMLATYAVIAAGGLFLVYYVLNFIFPKHEKTSYFNLAILSILSGFGNALVVFTVNDVVSRTSTLGFNRADNSTNILFIYFVMGLVLYVAGQRIIRPQLIKLSNNIIYKKRTELISNILRTSYQDLEKIKHENIQSCLNNDTEMISRIVNLIVGGVTSAITLIFCFIYLGTMNIYGALVTFGIVVLAAGVFFLIGKSANKLWEQTRDIQNVFFKYITDLMYGFKELSLNRSKRRAFQSDIVESCDEYRVKRAQGDIKFAGVFIAGELIFVLVLGLIAFMFPLIFPDNYSFIRDYVFVFIYMAGPIMILLQAIPEFTMVRISWKRIDAMSETLQSVARKSDDSLAATSEEEEIQLELRNVEYHYKNEHGEFFFGPFSNTFKSGEIVFITGGNGSGKSTLAKLMTTLYRPDAGQILLNSQVIEAEELSEYYSTVFADFHLFDRLYGIDYKNKEQDIQTYLKLLKLDEKIKIEDGVLKGAQLSTGQRKRLALLISYLEDRPICLFDEWAADQDPEFRKFFYHDLLPEMRKRGKLVIAITHDDMYFSLADKMIKLDLGHLVDSDESKKASE
ncbi:cyclic peptide export ABC transporter [Paenibacillus glacialis]|nr:cyclic peptide export ABC transporter [Paenibacillus glacialis]